MMHACYCNWMYRQVENAYEFIKKFQFKGAVEAMALAQVLHYAKTALLLCIIAGQ